MSKVSVAVKAATGKVVPQGTVTWTIQGTTIFTTTLTRQGQTSASICTMLMQFLPVTITYSGSSTFAPSTITLPATGYRN
jgi:hypothetical protein